MKILKALGNGVLFIERSVIVLLLSSMVILAFTQVILRNFFSMGFLWADPFLRHLVLWAGFIGASIATQQEKHITIDVITRFTSPRIANLIRIATNFFACYVTYQLAQAGWVFLQSEVESAEILLTIGTIDLPAWYFQIIIPAGFALISIRFLVRTIEHILRIFRPASTEEPSANIPTI